MHAGRNFLHHFRNALAARGPINQNSLVGDGGEIAVGIRHREGHEHANVGVPLLFDVRLEGALVADGVQPGTRDHHCLRAPAQLVLHLRPEVLDHDLGLLGDVVRVE